MWKILIENLIAYWEGVTLRVEYNVLGNDADCLILQVKDDIHI